MKWFIDAIKKYFVFSGRASRKAYWMFMLFNIIFGWVAIMIDNMLGTTNMSYNVWGVECGAFYNFYNLLILIPSLAILVRRLHDIGKRGGWFFIILIPVIGAIWLIVLLVQKGDLQNNEFGPVQEEI